MHYKNHLQMQTKYVFITCISPFYSGDMINVHVRIVWAIKVFFLFLTLK